MGLGEGFKLGTTDAILAAERANGQVATAKVNRGCPVGIHANVGFAPMFEYQGIFRFKRKVKRPVEADAMGFTKQFKLPDQPADICRFELLSNRQVECLIGK